MSKRPKIIVFDFDGVVCDSTDECMVTSWNAWEKWESRKSFRKTIDEFSKDEKSNFRKVRPRVRGAGEYYILRRAFSEGINIENQKEYNKLEEKWRENIEPFKAIFFKSREELRNNNIDAWVNLHPVFNDVIEVMKILNKRDMLYIATLKDAKSVKVILESKNIFLQNSNLYDQSQIKSKLQALDKFCVQINCSKNDMVFIDDNVTHLIEPKDAGYSVYLTTWGEVLDEYIKIAKYENIPLLNNIKSLSYF